MSSPGVLGLINPFKACKKNKDGNEKSAIRRANVKKVLQEKITELGRMTVHEMQVRPHTYLLLAYLKLLKSRPSSGLVLLRDIGAALAVQGPQIHQGLGQLCQSSVSQWLLRILDINMEPVYPSFQL